MFDDAGPSSKPLLSRGRSPNLDLDDIMISNGEEVSLRDKTVESPKQVSSSCQRPKCELRLSFLNIFDRRLR